MRPQFRHVLDEIVRAGDWAVLHYGDLDARLNYEVYLEPTSGSDFEEKMLRFTFELTYASRHYSSQKEKERDFESYRSMIPSTLRFYFGDWPMLRLRDKFEAAGSMLPVLRELFEMIKEKMRINGIESIVHNYVANELDERKLEDAEAYLKQYGNFIPRLYSYPLYFSFHMDKLLVRHHDLINELRRISNVPIPPFESRQSDPRNYHWTLGFRKISNPLSNYDFLLVKQDPEKFEFYLHWRTEDGDKRRSWVNGYDRFRFEFHSLKEARRCIAYIVKQVREHCHPDNVKSTISYLKGCDISYCGYVEAGEPYEYNIYGEPIKYRRADQEP